MLLRIHVLVDVPERLAEASGRFWSAALGQPLGPPWASYPAFRSFEPADGEAYVHQQVGDHGPRIHLDVEVDDRQSETARLEELGATTGQRTADWQTMVSPGGLPFCLVDASAAAAYPPPLAAEDGHRTRLVQVCIDSPAERHDAEVEFWRAATGWGWVPSEAEEFAGKLYPGLGSPVQLLLQRLGPDDPGRTVRAHIDLGTDDTDAEVRRLVALGAERGPPGRGWVAMTDPVGLAFCVTRNKPD